MRAMSTAGFALALCAALAIMLLPVATWASGLGSGKSQGSMVTCKSGAKVPNPRACKENGGRR